MRLRTTINISDSIIKETEALYNAGSRSEAIEEALKVALRYKKIQLLKSMKGRITFDEEKINSFRQAEIYETPDNG